MKRRNFIGTLIAGLGAMAAPICEAKKPMMISDVGGTIGHFSSPQRNMMFAAMAEQHRVPTDSSFPRVTTGYET